MQANAQKAEMEAASKQVVSEQEKAGATDVEMTEREMAAHDRGMHELLSNVVVVGTVPASEAADRSCLEDFPKISVKNGTIRFLHNSASNRNIFEVTNSRFEYFQTRLALVEERIFSHPRCSLEASYSREAVLIATNVKTVVVICTRSTTSIPSLEALQGNVSSV